MSSITISDLSSLEVENTGYRVKDINLHHSDRIDSIDVTDYWAIREAIQNVFSVDKGSRYTDLNFGSNIRDFLFEKLTKDNAQLLGEEIEQSLEQLGNLINVIEINVDMTKGNFDVGILYAIPSISNERLDMQLSLDRAEGLVFGGGEKVN